MKDLLESIHDRSDIKNFQENFEEYLYVRNKSKIW